MCTVFDETCTCMYSVQMRSGDVFNEMKLWRIKDLADEQGFTVMKGCEN